MSKDNRRCLHTTPCCNTPGRKDSSSASQFLTATCTAQPNLFVEFHHCAPYRTPLGGEKLALVTRQAAGVARPGVPATRCVGALDSGSDEVSKTVLIVRGFAGRPGIMNCICNAQKRSIEVKPQLHVLHSWYEIMCLSDSYVQTGVSPLRLGSHACMLWARLNATQPHHWGGLCKFHHSRDLLALRLLLDYLSGLEVSPLCSAGTARCACNLFASRTQCQHNHTLTSHTITLPPPHIPPTQSIQKQTCQRS